MFSCGENDLKTFIVVISGCWEYGDLNVLLFAYLYFLNFQNLICITSIIKGKAIYM